MKVTLKAARINKGLNQDEAAEILGVSRTTINSWETNKTFPTVLQMKSIESAYGVRYDDLIFLPDSSTLSITSEEE